MRKTNKKNWILTKIFAVVMVFGLMLGLTACGNTQMTNAQINEVFKNAANSFYANHKETENFSAITYHFVETEKEKTIHELEYKANPEDEELTTGTFEYTINSKAEKTLAIKKEGEHLVAEMTVVITTTETGTDVDEEDGHLIEINDTTVETKNYRMFHYTEDLEQKNILVYNYNKTLNGEDVPGAQVKQYAKKSVYFAEEYSMEEYDKFVNQSLIHITNEKIADCFFNYSEAILFYSSMVTAEQNGNETNITIGYNIVSINEENWGVADICSYMTSSFKDGKIWKAECSAVHTFETGSMERKVTFDYTNGATVNMQVPEDLATYTNNGDIWTNSSNPDGSLRGELYYLPAISIF